MYNINEYMKKRNFSQILDREKIFRHGPSSIVVSAINSRPTTVASLVHWLFTLVYGVMGVNQRVARVGLRQLGLVTNTAVTV